MYLVSSTIMLNTIAVPSYASLYCNKTLALAKTKSVSPRDQAAVEVQQKHFQIMIPARGNIPVHGTESHSILAGTVVAKNR
jgi:hypothetical protein